MPAAKLKLRSKPAKSSAIRILNDDCLRLCFEQVYHANFNDLLVLSRVSHQFYYFAVPWIYRDVAIDFSKAKDLRLLRRLVRPGSCLPSRTRTLAVNTTAQTTREQIAELTVLCEALSNLTQIQWSGTINIHPLILSAFQKCPKARAELHGTCLAQTDMLQSYNFQWNTLLHPVASQLSSFSFRPTESAQLYPDFKKDLLAMMAANKALTYLEVFPSFVTEVSFPEMMRHFRHDNCPRLQNLMTTIDLFTLEELSLWGKKGGWDQLELLYTKAKYLPAYVGQAPKLDYLGIFFQSMHDMDEVTEYVDSMESTSNASVLPHMHKLSYSDPWRISFLNNQYARQVFPWSLLKLLPELTELDSLCYFGSDRTLYFPVADELRVLRKLCPDLQVLKFDMAIDSKRWPFDVLAEVARFEKLRHVVCQLHFGPAPSAKSFVKKRRCRQAFKYMKAIRAASGLPVNDVFTADFNAAMPVDQPEDEWCVPEYSFAVTHRGAIETYTSTSSAEHRQRKAQARTYDDLADAELKSRCVRKVCKVLTILPFVVLRPPAWFLAEGERMCKMMDEVERRKYTARAAQKFDDDVTLFDRWSGLARIGR